MAVFTKPRQEPSFADMRRIADAEGLPPLRASDYAQPDVRAVADVEEEIGKLVAQDPMIRSRDHRAGMIGNTVDMQRVQQMLSNSVTKAHDDACKAVDRIVEEARALVVRIEKAADAHKISLKRGGEQIAVELESAVQALHRTVEWVEKQSPDLRNPTLTQPPEKNHKPKKEAPKPETGEAASES